MLSPNALPRWEKPLLQGCVGLGALVPIAAGGWGAIASLGMLDIAAPAASADSHFRYLSGLLLAIGLAFWSTIPGIERKAGMFRLLVLLVLAGGIARLASLAVAGPPSAAMIAALVMELAVTPLLGLWQARIARRA